MVKRILLVATGSRGDVQPMIALSQGLISAGYDVTLMAGSNFKTWVESYNINFWDIGVDMQAIMSGSSGKEWIEGSSNSSLAEARNMRRMVGEMEDDLVLNLLEASEQADVLVSGLPVFGIIDAIAEKTGKTHINILLSPLLPAKEGAATLVPTFPKRRSWFNYMTGFIGMYFVWWIFKDSTNHFRTQNGLNPTTYRQFHKRWRSLPVLHGMSPLITPNSQEWNDQTTVSGYWFLDEGTTWQPSQALVDFIQAGEPPVYIGFGSMTSKNPQATGELLMKAIVDSGERGIINTGWAGFNSSDIPEQVFLIDGAPHDWLFPQMKAIVHHGGAGTTAAALRSGKPNMVVSHMADQPYWGRRVHELGVGANFIRRHQLTAEGLAQAIREMASQPEIAQNAASLGEKIRAEDGVARAVEYIQSVLS